MPVGLSFRLALAGSWATLDRPGEERPLTLTLQVEARDVVKLAIDPIADAQGELDAEGLADHRAVRGTIRSTPLAGALAYELRFAGNDGEELRLRATSDADPLHPLRSLATAVGSIFAGEREIARVVLRVGKASAPLHALVSLLRTVRPR